jgi:hypothetical protein
MQTQAVLTDWHTLGEIRTALHAGHITGGMTIELSLQHPELQDSNAIERFVAYVSGYGVRVDRMRGLAPGVVYLRR